MPKSRSIDVSTQVCAVLGDPVAHSLSPCVHNAAFEACDLDWIYVAHRVRNLKSAIEGVRSLESYRGLSITIPHKIEGLGLVDEADVLAQDIGAINTVVRQDDGRLIGHNTDGIGALRALHAHAIDLQGKRLLVLGAGGAARGIVATLLREASPSHMTILSRRKGSATELLASLKLPNDASTEAGCLSTLPSAMASHDIVIQTTPVGMSPQTEDTPVDGGLFGAQHVVMDIVYNPLETRMLREARRAGSKVIDGAWMFVAQAAAQFEIWTGLEAPISVMEQVARERLSSRRAQS